MAYSDKVIDHYENPRNVGSFDKSDNAVGTGMVPMRQRALQLVREGTTTFDEFAKLRL